MSIFGWSYPAGCSGPPAEGCAEVCVGGKPNWDEEAEEWVCPEAEEFCSVECASKYLDDCRRDERSASRGERVEENER